MAILNPAHFFDQAEALATTPSVGSLRQVDLRRAISSAYYGVFHFILAAVADEFVGSSRRSTARYALVYRSIDHKTLRDLCNEVRKTTPSPRYTPYVPSRGFGPDIPAFAWAASELQEKRHTADYNPIPRFQTADAAGAVVTARNAILTFQQASREQRKTFLTLLLCPPR